MALAATESLAAECTVRSGPQTATLVELYTSEGCSSCPPADRWLSSFAQRPGTQGVVPIAFHVSYWDYIGWKDVFADERYTVRQRALAKATGARMVYTPQVMLDGRDFRGWDDARAVSKAIAASNGMMSRVQIDVAWKPPSEAGASGTASATLRPGVKADDLALFVAITQNGLSSRVTAGENRGEKLAHSFVARDLAVIRVSGAASSPLLRGAFAFKPRADWKLENMSLVAFVQNLKTGEVLQALSAPVCRG
jgi:hypothetical protein